MPPGTLETGTDFTPLWKLPACICTPHVRSGSDGPVLFPSCPSPSPSLGRARCIHLSTSHHTGVHPAPAPPPVHHHAPPLPPAGRVHGKPRARLPRDLHAAPPPPLPRPSQPCRWFCSPQKIMRSSPTGRSELVGLRLAPCRCSRNQEEECSGVSVTARPTHVAALHSLGARWQSFGHRESFASAFCGVSPASSGR